MLVRILNYPYSPVVFLCRKKNEHWELLTVRAECLTPVWYLSERRSCLCGTPGQLPPSHFKFDYVDVFQVEMRQLLQIFPAPYTPDI